MLCLFCFVAVFIACCLLFGVIMVAIVPLLLFHFSLFVTVLHIVRSSSLFSPSISCMSNNFSFVRYWRVEKVTFSLL